MNQINIGLYEEDFTEEEKELLNKVKDLGLPLLPGTMDGDKFYFDSNPDSINWMKAMNLLKEKGYFYDVFSSKEEQEIKVNLELTADELGLLSNVLMDKCNSSRKNGEVFEDIHAKIFNAYLESTGRI